MPAIGNAQFVQEGTYQLNKRIDQMDNQVMNMLCYVPEAFLITFNVINNGGRLNVQEQIRKVRDCLPRTWDSGNLLNLLNKWRLGHSLATG
jgi:hypothetical protein